MNTNTETYKTGLTLLNQLHGGHAGEQMIAAMKDICPDFATMSIDWAMGGIMARPGLDLLTREYVIIAACVTLGHAAPQLRAHIDAALKLGATKQQVMEVILQTIFYAGGAAVANALIIAHETAKAHADAAKGA
jgi:4-carboxymuconolactone decarboxylase